MASAAAALTLPQACYANTSSCLYIRIYSVVSEDEEKKMHTDVWHLSVQFRGGDLSSHQSARLRFHRLRKLRDDKENTTEDRKGLFSLRSEPQSQSDLSGPTQSKPGEWKTSISEKPDTSVWIQHPVFQMIRLIDMMCVSDQLAQTSFMFLYKFV